MRLSSSSSLLVALAALSSACGPAEPPFLVEVVRFQPGDGAGFGHEDNVLGPPEGAGMHAGGLDVLSLGQGGEIVARLGRPAVDGEGADLLVFENAFVTAGSGAVTFVEPGEVSVSADGETWHTFGCAADDEERPGCAGLEPVYAHVDNDVDPRDPAEAGGDAFDLADVGLGEAWFVRVRDRSAGRPGLGIENYGFDLDAVAAVHTFGD